MEKVCNFVVGIILVSVLTAGFLLAIPLLCSKEVYPVLSDSMETNYPKGTLVIVDPVSPEKIQLNDVITFARGNGFETRRVIHVNSGEQSFLTKGDSSNAIDAHGAPFSSLKGKVLFGIPYLGYIVYEINTPKGIMISAAILLLLVFFFVLPGFFHSDPEEEEPRE